MTDNCPDCGAPYALVGRAHRCIPSERRESPAGTLLVGANQSAMGVTPPVEGESLTFPANRGEAANNSPRKWPKRQRAAYMRQYRAKRKLASA